MLKALISLGFRVVENRIFDCFSDDVQNVYHNWDE